MSQPARVHSLIRQGVAASMAQHVDVDREGQPRGFASPLDHPRNPFPLEWITPFVDEEIGTAARQSAKPSQLIALKVVRAVP